MIKYFAIAFLCLFALLSSCTETQKKVSTEQLLENILEAETQLSDKNSEKALSQEEKISFWKDELNKDRYASDEVAKASINYQIGKSFAPINIDSAEMYTTKALILLEDVEDFDNEKTFIYTGLGIIADNKEKEFLASFYYHKIISILDANPSMSTVSVKKKIQSYLSSVQVNSHIELHENAYELTRKAASYMDSIPENDFLRFRIYTQLFLVFTTPKKILIHLGIT